MEMAQIGATPKGGVKRLTLTDLDLESRTLFQSWCDDAGLTTEIDQMGSMFARRSGADDSLPPVMIGSHLDTQPTGGKFDGALGVLAALELVRTLNDLDITTRRPIEIVNWTNEEGARFSPPMVASGCFVGAYDLEWTLARPADDGPALGDELKRIGYAGARPCRAGPVDAYFELHIEQGPILHAEGKTVGVVTSAFPSTGLLVEFRGETAHTGPWPMPKRQNALVAAARFLTAVDDLGWTYAAGGGKGTAARLTAWPNKPGILSDWAQTVTDVRHPDAETQAAMAEAMRRAAAEAAARAGCTFEILDTWTWGGDIFASDLVDSVRSVAIDLETQFCDIQSQAGHDAYFLARHCPTAMIFTPCRDGITHNNREHCDPGDFEDGLNVLLHTAVRRADRDVH